MVRPSARRSGRRARSRSAPSTRPARRGSAASSRTRRPASPHSSPATVSVRSGHVAQGVDEQVDALVVAHDAEREQPRRAVVVGRAAGGGPPGRCGGRSAIEHVRAPSSAARRACSVGVHDDGVDAAQQRLHQLPVAGVALVRQHVVRDEHDARAATGRACGRRRRRAAARGAPGTTARDDVHDDHDVDVAQPAPGAHPGVGPGPGQRPHGARERRRRPARRRAPPARPGRARPGRGGSTTRA